MNFKSNKYFLKSSLFIIIMLLISGIGLAYNEAPEMKGKVETGELPVVEDRLPEDPFVVEPVDRVGDYGGTWDMLIMGPSKVKAAVYFTDIKLVTWDRNQTKIIPEVAKSWESSEDGKVFTFKLREGMKWSDGHSFTADDIVFWYEDIINNDEITPAKPSFMEIGGELGEVVKKDKYTVEFRFSEPNGLLLYSLAGFAWPWAPKHYLKQFHIDYADEDELNEKVEESEYDTWYDLFIAKNNYTYSSVNPNLPVIYPWVATNEPPAERFVLKRNPYFFKVDTEGNQLPYIDEWKMNMVQDEEVLNMNTVAGKSDLQVWRMSFKNYTLYKENENEGDYEVLLWENDWTARPAIFPNQNVNDPVLKDLFQDKKFRRALSLGIDREKINHVVFKGYGKPMQLTAPPTLDYVKEEYVNAYADYNLEKANQMLDEIGLEEKNNQGYRIRPDGKPLQITIFTPGEEPETVDVLELIKEDWEKIGIDLTIKPLERTLYRMRMRTGQAEMGIWQGQFDPSRPYQFAPASATGTYWAPQWAQWYQTGEEEIQLEEEEANVAGVKPPEYIRELQETWDILKVTPDQEKQAQLYGKLLEAQAENIWGIGTVGLVPQPIVKKTYFKNVPEKALYSWAFGMYLGPHDPSHFFIEEEAQNK